MTEPEVLAALIADLRALQQEWIRRRESAQMFEDRAWQRGSEEEGRFRREATVYNICQGALTPILARAELLQKAK